MVAADLKRLLLPALLSVFLQKQQLTVSTVRLPVGLVQAHMPEVAALAVNTSHAIKVEVVLLPPCASDISVATPAQDVVDIHGVTVTRYRSYSMQPNRILYTLAGKGLQQLTPQAKAQWYIRCECHMLLLP
jgi:hypothetical protein